jgi:hypothetical protein
MPDVQRARRSLRRMLLSGLKTDAERQTVMKFVVTLGWV